MKDAWCITQRVQIIGRSWIDHRFFLVHYVGANSNTNEYVPVEYLYDTEAEAKANPVLPPSVHLKTDLQRDKSNESVFLKGKLIRVYIINLAIVNIFHVIVVALKRGMIDVTKHTLV